jgi:DNA polymerase V
MKQQDILKIVAIAQLTQAQSCALPFPDTLIPAGFPSSAENFIENSLDLNDLLISHPSSTFFIRVIGDSMIDAGINSHDILIIDRSLTLTNNKIAVVRINDEFTVKRVKLDGTHMVLMPANSKYQPITVTADMDVEVWGIVTFVIHQMI